MTRFPESAAEARIRQVWEEAAAPWTAAVRAGLIRSRVLVTNAAIIEAVLALKPMRVLDLGCGEGWLLRELAARGLDPAGLVGVDGSAALIAQARAAGSGRFLHADYADLTAARQPEFEPGFDLVVANFSLIGDASSVAALRAARELLRPAGQLLIQTLSPRAVARGDGAGHSGEPFEGWREGSWQGCGDGFGDAAPWYCRSLNGWLGLLAQLRLTLASQQETVDPATGAPLSLLLRAGKG